MPESLKVSRRGPRGWTRLRVEELNPRAVPALLMGMVPDPEASDVPAIFRADDLPAGAEVTTAQCGLNPAADGSAAAAASGESADPAVFDGVTPIRYSLLIGSEDDVVSPADGSDVPATEGLPPIQSFAPGGAATGDVAPVEAATDAPAAFDGVTPNHFFLLRGEVDPLPIDAAGAVVPIESAGVTPTQDFASVPADGSAVPDWATGDAPAGEVIDPMTFENQVAAEGGIMYFGVGGKDTAAEGPAAGGQTALDVGTSPATLSPTAVDVTGLTSTPVTRAFDPAANESSPTPEGPAALPVAPRPVAAAPAANQTFTGGLSSLDPAGLNLTSGGSADRPDWVSDATHG